MKIIFAQGNPGAKYAKTRHNIGFMVIDELAKSKNALWITKSKLKAEVAEIGTGQEKVILVKPTVFYNETGAVLQAIANFHKVTTKSILVIHDDIVLPLGTIRTRKSGRDAGNNGIKSINQQLGEDFWRVRVGVQTSLQSRIEDTKFVLGKFSLLEKRKLSKQIIPAALQTLQDFIEGNITIQSKKV